MIDSGSSGASSARPAQEGVQIEGAQTEGAPTADAPTADAPTAGAPTADAPTAGVLTAEGRLRLIERRFGLRWVTHRVGERTIRAAEVRDVDPCVEALYPHCLVDHGDAPVWMITWPAAFALCELLLMEVPLRGQRVLELGCGTALPGVAAALGGAQVVSTDYDDYALAVAAENCRANGVQLTLGRLDWYAPRLGERFAYVIGSEITYHEQAFDPLLRLLGSALLPGGRVLLADVFRSQSGAFLALCRAAGWEVREHRRLVHLSAESRAVRIAELWRPDAPMPGVA